MKTILAVDDSRSDLRLVEAVLQQCGFRVVGLGSATSALSYMDQEIPDLIILDVVMPEMNGFDLCRQIRANPKLEQVPIVFCTSKDQEFDRFWANRQGGNRYIVKPFAPKELIDTVQDFLN